MYFLAISITNITNYFRHVFVPFRNVTTNPDIVFREEHTVSCFMLFVRFLVTGPEGDADQMPAAPILLRGVLCLGAV